MDAMKRLVQQKEPLSRKLKNFEYFSGDYNYSDHFLEEKNELLEGIGSDIKVYRKDITLPEVNVVLLERQLLGHYFENPIFLDAVHLAQGEKGQSVQKSYEEIKEFYGQWNAFFPRDEAEDIGEKCISGIYGGLKEVFAPSNQQEYDQKLQYLQELIPCETKIRLGLVQDHAKLVDNMIQKHYAGK